MDPACFEKLFERTQIIKISYSIVGEEPRKAMSNMFKCLIITLTVNQIEQKLCINVKITAAGTAYLELRACSVCSPVASDYY